MNTPQAMLGPKTMVEAIYQCEYMGLVACRHGAMLLNTNDTTLGAILAYYGEFDECELNLLCSLIEPMDIVWDVGANIGTHAIVFARHGLAVLAFEPQRLIFQTLCGNMALNAIQNVIAYPYAIGAQNKIIRPGVADPRQRTAFSSITMLENGGVEDVQMTRIDDIPGRCDFLKIDVEGMECDVLEGAEKKIQQYKPILYVENNHPSKSVDLLSRVRDLGYVAYWSLAWPYNPNNFWGLPNVFSSHKEIRPNPNILCHHASKPCGPINLPKVDGVHDNWERLMRK